MSEARGDFPPEPPFDCPRCPRLVEYRKQNARNEPDWHNAPVHSFGDTGARLLIVGLAPGRTGANRTARPFTGDWAGDLLYPTLQKFGFARGEYDRDGDDDLRLVEAMITNAVRCVPPENKPTGQECNRCRPFLTARIEELPQLEIILALGGIAHTNTLRAPDFLRRIMGFPLLNYLFFGLLYVGTRWPETNTVGGFTSGDATLEAFSTLITQKRSFYFQVHTHPASRLPPP